MALIDRYSNWGEITLLVGFFSPHFNHFHPIYTDVESPLRVR